MTQTPVYEILFEDQLMETPKVDWLIEGLIRQGTLVEIYGPPKSFKSFIALDWALSIIHGKDWIGRHKVKQGDVVYIYAEGKTGHAGRVAAWRKENGTGKPLNRTLASLCRSVHLGEKAVREGVEQTIDAYSLKPVLIVIDTLARNFGGGDPDKTKDMQSFIDQCTALRERYDATVLIIHHTGHAGGRSRNSSALPAALDSAFKVEKRDRRSFATRLETEFQKDGDLTAGIPLALKMVELGEGVSSLVVKPSDALSDSMSAIHPRRKPATILERMYEALAKFGDEGATVEEWRGAFSPGCNPKKGEGKSFSNYVSGTELERQGRAEKRSDRYFATESGVGKLAA